MNIIWVPRSRWGSTKTTEDFIKARSKVPALLKKEIHVHHTASIDSDDNTPNRWDYDEAVRYMRSLQTARPELGPLPYNDNVAVSEDAQTVWVFEGRGALTLGAHTAGHNYYGYGIGIFGNFDKGDTVAAQAAVSAIEWRVYQLIQSGLTNLGSVKNPKGWNAWGHRDSSTKTCPGASVYPLLANFSLKGDDEMTPEQEAKLDAVLAQIGNLPTNTARQTLNTVWLEEGIPPFSVLQAVARTYKFIVRNGTDLTEFDDDELTQIKVAVADEIARRVAQ